MRDMKVVEVIYKAARTEKRILVKKMSLNHV